MQQTLKGPVEKRITVRQFLWDVRDIADGAGYCTGDEVLLFLNRPTSLGLVSPVGLEQGRFRIQRRTNAEPLVINGAGNRGLMDSLVASGKLRARELTPATRTTVQTFHDGPLPLSVLKESVKVLLHASPEVR